MTNTQNPSGPTPPPDRHQLAVMIWLCLFPPLTALNVTVGNRLASMSPVLRTFVLATIAVPVVVYGLVAPLHRARIHPAVTPALGGRGVEHSGPGREQAPSSANV